MGNLIVKSNAFIEASYELGVVEQRLIFLAILKARETDSVSEAIGKTLTIHASDYMSFFDVDRNAAYQSLEDGVNGLYEAEYTYQTKLPNGKIKKHRHRFAEPISYSEGMGCVELTFTPSTVPLIVGLSENFTKYEIEQIARLTSRYALRLYELLARWRSNGKFMVSLDELRSKFGLLNDEYPRMDNFKRWVLDMAVNEINGHTDLTVHYEQHKQGRKIVGFTFTIKFKTKPKKPKEKDSLRDQNTPDMLSPIKMTDKQRATFASKLAELGELGDYAPIGMSMQDYIKKIESDLLDPQKAEFYRPYLEQIGFIKN